MAKRPRKPLIVVNTEKEEPNNVFQLFPVPGGKQPNGDWLTPLGVKAIFLCRGRSHQGPFIDEFQINHISDKAVLLYSNLNEVTYHWVDPIKFCAIMELVELLREGESE